MRIAGDLCPCQSLPGGGEPYCGARLFSFGACYKITDAQTRALEVQAFALTQARLSAPTLSEVISTAPAPPWTERQLFFAFASDLNSLKYVVVKEIYLS